MDKAVLFFIAIIMLCFSSSAVLAVLYTQTNIFKNVGDSCKPTTVITGAATYAVDANKNCKANACIIGYTLDATGICTLASTPVTTNSNSETTTTENGSQVVTKVSSTNIPKPQCDGKIKATGCMTQGVSAGVSWTWTCDSKPKYWYVEAYTSFDNDFIIKTKVDGKVTSAGFKGLLPPFMKDTYVTFEIMPYDENNNPMLTNKFKIKVDQSTTKKCDSTVTDAFTNWNENNNLVKIQMIVGGGAQLGIGMTIKGDDANLNGKENWFSGYKALYTNYSYTYPKGYTVSAWCQGTRNRWKGYIPSEINAAADKYNNQISIEGSCFDNAGYARNTLSLGPAKKVANSAARYWSFDLA